MREDVLVGLELKAIHQLIVIHLLEQLSVFDEQALVFARENIEPPLEPLCCFAQLIFANGVRLNMEYTSY